MAQDNTAAGATAWLTFLIGALLVGIVSFGLFALAPHDTQTADLSINPPRIELPDPTLPPHVEPSPPPSAPDEPLAQPAN